MPQEVNDRAGSCYYESVSSVCARVSAELQRLSVITVQLEASLSSAADGWAVDERRLRDLQQLDALSQHLAALRDFMASLPSSAFGGVDLAPSLKLVPLEALRGRLAGEAPARDEDTTVELFG